MNYLLKTMLLYQEYFLSLVISINTPLYLVILGSIIASLSKVLTGGFGKNKLNPALAGSLFITVIFSSLVGEDI